MFRNMQTLIIRAETFLLGGPEDISSAIVTCVICHTIFNPYRADMQYNQDISKPFASEELKGYGVPKRKISIKFIEADIKKCHIYYNYLPS